MRLLESSLMQQVPKSHVLAHIYFKLLGHVNQNMNIYKFIHSLTLVLMGFLIY